VLEYLVDDKHIIDMSKVGISVDKPNHKVLFVSVGTLNDRAKNFTLMIKMMQNLIKLNNHVELWILGDGPDLVNIKMLVKQSNLDNYIKLFGFKNNPYPYMKMADYYLNTADNYDSSTALIEARVLEKPIISTNPDDINKNIYIVSPDPNKIANDVNDILVKKIMFDGVNNFWEENQHILKKFEKFIG
jgi:glycosyltransferase involved in cell wall biosynthesis